MNIELFGYLATFVSLVGIVLNSKKKMACWIVWLFSNIMWIIYSAIEGDVPSISLWILFSIFNIYGWIQWRKDLKPRLETMDMVSAPATPGAYMYKEGKEIEFANWLNKNYNIENGIGYWSDFTDDDTQYTTEELLTKFNQENIR